LLLLLSRIKEEEREVWVLRLREWEDGESGTNEFIHSDDAIDDFLWLCSHYSKRLKTKREKYKKQFYFTQKLTPQPSIFCWILF
jgi:hypothetical protein